MDQNNFTTKKRKKNEKNENFRKQYICELCDFKSFKKTDYFRHIETNKHREKMGQKKCAKSAHQKNENLENNENIIIDGNATICKKPVLYKCECCDKLYKTDKYRKRHQEVCILRMQENEINKLKIENAKIEGKKEAYEGVISNGNVGNTINNNCNIQNNNFNIKLYLNNDCANAMSIQDFLSNMKVTIADLDYTTQNGFISGISKILKDNLDLLEPEERPIHCSNKKKQQFYIKNEDKWHKDDGNEQTDDIIDRISHKQSKQIAAWKEANPGWETSITGMDKFHKMVQTVLGGSTDDILAKKRRGIRKELTELTVIDKDIMSNK